MSRHLRTARLLELGDSLSDVERAVLRDVARLRLLSHAQLAVQLDLASGDRSAGERRS